jgi:hypothetical protein
VYDDKRSGVKNTRIKNTRIASVRVALRLGISLPSDTVDSEDPGAASAPTVHVPGVLTFHHPHTSDRPAASLEHPI